MSDRNQVVTVELSDDAAKRFTDLAEGAAAAVKVATETNERTAKLQEQVVVLQGTVEQNLKALQEVVKSGGPNDPKKLAEEAMKLVDQGIAERAGRGLVDPKVAASMAKLQDPWDAKGDYLNWQMRRGEASSNDLLETALQSTTMSENHKAFKRQADDMIILSAIAHRLGRNAALTIQDKMPGVWRKWCEYRRAMLSELKATVEPADTVANTSWIPAPFSSELREIVMLEARVPSLFPSVFIGGPGKTWTSPVDLTDVLPDFITETQTYKNPYEAADPTQLGQAISDSNRVFTPAKHRVRFMLSGEFNEDSIIPAIPLIRSKFVKTMRNGHEKVIIDGQKTGNIDTGGGGPGTYDIRKASDGIRFFCSAGQANVLYNVGSDNLLYGDIVGARQPMGEYGMNAADLALIVGPSGFLQLLKIAEVTTADKFGSGAAIFTGAIAAIGGIGVVPSRYIREDLNASGIYDAVTTTQTIAILVHRDTFLTVEKRAITVEEDRLIPTDQWDLVAMRRLDFRQALGNTQKSACVLYNIDTAIA